MRAAVLWCYLSYLSGVAPQKGRGRHHHAVEAVAPPQQAPDGAAFDPDANICLLTIMTQERRASLHRMLATWDGYISIALLVDDYAAAVAQGLDVLAYQGRGVPAPERVTLTVIEDRGYRAPRNRFPYNMLRNAALRGCEAEYVLAADVDFVPMPSRPSRMLRAHLAALDVRAGSPAIAVLAAFEQVQLTPAEAAAAAAASRDADADAPSTSGASSSPMAGATRAQPPALDVAQLRGMVRRGEAIGFASNVYEMGHKCDHTATFLGARAPYAVEYEFGCEPYTIVPRATAHLYEERFVGYGKDRVSWNYELAAKGSLFHVLPDAFLIHFNTYDEPKKKAKYGHFPTDWMLGESCWQVLSLPRLSSPRVSAAFWALPSSYRHASSSHVGLACLLLLLTVVCPPSRCCCRSQEFRERVRSQYNFSVYSCHQQSIDGMRHAKWPTCVAEKARRRFAPSQQATEALCTLPPPHGAALHPSH